jgi:hypothetical protein
MIKDFKFLIIKYDFYKSNIFLIILHIMNNKSYIYIKY